MASSIAVRWFVLWICVSSFCTVTLGQEPRLYRITEHDEETFITNLVIDFNIANEYTTEEINRLSFVLLEDEQGLSDLFTVNGGVLQVKSPINRENICPQSESCVIDLDIKTEPLELYKLLKVRVDVQDKNDNAPQFNEGLAVAVNVSESVREGTLLALPQAVDLDSPTYGTKWYEIFPLSDTFTLLQDSSSPSALEPKLKVEVELDREGRDLYEFKLTAYDGGDPARFSSINISIHVLDSNDNSPEFTKEYYAKRVNEDIPVGSSIIKVTAEDKDTGPYGVVQYSFDTKTATQHGHLFTIDQASGVIYVKSELDYETVKQHMLTVEAKDNPTDSGGIARVNVSLNDVNDNRPKVTLRDVEEGSSLEVSEHSAIGTFVGHVTVEDLDSGNNGQFDCVIDKSEFYLESLYATDFKLITTESLDREDQADYTIQMTCQDRGNPALQSSKLIPVTVTDINDKAPKFTTSTFVGNALESVVVGGYIMRVTAKDLDIGINAEIEYSIVGAYKDVFAIDIKSGNISSKVPLDYEREDRVQFVVKVTDKGSPSLSSTATVIIDIIDEDDNVPVFTPIEFDFKVAEMELPSTEVGQVTAEDADSDAFSHFTYGIEENKYFTIDPYSGIMYTKMKIDREATPMFRIEVFAVVSTTFNPSTSTATVIVDVLDKNDNDPIINFPSPQNNTVHIPNTLTRGEIVTYIQADDQDIDQNAQLTYSIVAGNQDSYFLIDSNLGAILVHKSLQAIETRAFGIVIKVTDNGLPPRATETYLNIIVNKSLTSPTDDMLDRTNLSIVIGIACVSAIIILILLIAIVVIVIQKRKNRLSKLIYNYAPKIMDRKSFLANQKKKSCVQGTHAPPKGSKDDPEGGFTNLALENEHQLPAVHNNKEIPRYEAREYDRDSACSAETDSGRGSNEDFSHERIRHPSSPPAYNSHLQLVDPSRLASRQQLASSQHNSASSDISQGTKHTNPLYGVVHHKNPKHSGGSIINTQHLNSGTFQGDNSRYHIKSSPTFSHHNHNNSSSDLFRDNRRRDLLYRDVNSPPSPAASSTVGEQPRSKRVCDTNNEQDFVRLSGPKRALHEVHV